MSDTTVTNPGTVNVADQGDGLVSVDQCVSIGPSQSSGPTVPGTGAGPARNYLDGQSIIVTSPMTAAQTVDGDDYSPTSGNCSTFIENNVVGQIYGAGSPTNVYV